MENNEEKLGQKDKQTAVKVITITLLVVGLLVFIRFTQQEQQSRQYAQASGGDFCSALMLASSSQFKSQKANACNQSFRSFALSQIKTSSGCVSDAEAGAALDGACSLPADQIPATGCSGRVISSVPEFINNKSSACGTNRTVWVNGLSTVTNGEKVCATQADAENAMNEACGGPAPSPTFYCIGGGCNTPAPTLNPSITAALSTTQAPAASPTAQQQNQQNQQQNQQQGQQQNQQQNQQNQQQGLCLPALFGLPPLCLPPLPPLCLPPLPAIGPLPAQQGGCLQIEQVVAVVQGVVQQVAPIANAVVGVIAPQLAPVLGLALGVLQA